MMSTGICDKCWGSGDDKKPGVNLRILRNILTEDQLEMLCLEGFDETGKTQGCIEYVGNGG